MASTDDLLRAATLNKVVSGVAVDIEKETRDACGSKTKKFVPLKIYLHQFGVCSQCLDVFCVDWNRLYMFIC